MAFVKFSSRYIDTTHIDIIHYDEKKKKDGSIFSRQYRLEMDNNSTQHLNGEQGDYLLGVIGSANIDSGYKGSNKTVGAGTKPPDNPL